MTLLDETKALNVAYVASVSARGIALKFERWQKMEEVEGGRRGNLLRILLFFCSRSNFRATITLA